MGMTTARVPECVWAVSYAGVSHYSGPGFYRPWGYGPGLYQPWWGLYDPFWSSSYLHPGLYQRVCLRVPNLGQIKLDAPKDASVYLDGGFAGSAQKLKSIWLEPGIYELQVDRRQRRRIPEKSLRTQRKNSQYSGGAKPMKRAGALPLVVCDTRRVRRRAAGSFDGRSVCGQSRGQRAHGSGRSDGPGAGPQRVLDDACAELSSSRSCYIPAEGSTVDISVIDFALRVDGRLIRPAEPRTIAVRNQKKANRGGRDITLWPSVGVSTGTWGTGTNVGVGVGVGGRRPGPGVDGPRSPSDGDRTRRSQPAGRIADKPVAGYLYFPVGETKARSTSNLSTSTTTETLQLPLDLPKKK